MFTEPLRWCETIKGKNIPQMPKLGLTLVRQLLASGSNTGRQHSHFLSFQCCQFPSCENMLNLQTLQSIDII